MHTRDVQDPLGTQTRWWRQRPLTTAAVVLWFVLPTGVGAPRVQASTYTVLHYFSYYDGSLPQSTLIDASDGALYGTTLGGGDFSYSGVVFKLNKDGTGFEKIHDFNGSDVANGSWPYAGVVEGSDGALYGTTYSGGAFGGGVVFKLNKDGTDYLNLHDFDMSDGANPEASLVEGSDGALYGTTHNGGSLGNGVVFKLDKDGAGFLKLHDFGGSDGGGPYAGLVEGSDGVLYGTTQFGGAFGGGVIFKLNKDGTGFLALHEFAGNDGTLPSAGLVEASDAALYGTTSYGGAFGNGVIFKLNMDGSGFLSLHDFDGPNGAVPFAGVVEGSDSALWGTTSIGGVFESGVIFNVNKDGTTFQNLHDFDRLADGAVPLAGLVEGFSGFFFGTAYTGNPSGNGTVFRFALGCEVSVQVEEDVHMPGSTVSVHVHIAHNRPKIVTVPWEMRLIDASGQVIAKHTTEPHTFEPGDVVDREVDLALPNNLSPGIYTLELAISGMAGTKGVTTTFQVVGPSTSQ